LYAVPVNVFDIDKHRFLVKEFAAVLSGEPAHGSCSYLAKERPLCNINSKGDCTNLSKIAAAFKSMSY